MQRDSTFITSYFKVQEGKPQEHVSLLGSVVVSQNMLKVVSFLYSICILDLNRNIEIINPTPYIAE